MKVFISWSGERSQQFAIYLKGWLRRVLQSTEPWVSSNNIESGSNWFTEVNNQLATTEIGIICLTQENKDNPWILFESGALIKGLTETRVIPLLIDFKKTELRPPLSLLQAIYPTKDEVYKLVDDINNKVTDARKLSSVDLDYVFNLNWPPFEETIQKIKSEDNSAPKPESRSSEELLEEVLSTIRTVDNRTRVFESRIQDPSEIYNLNSNAYKTLEYEITKNVYNESFVKQFSTYGELIDSFRPVLQPFYLPEAVAEELLMSTFRRFSLYGHLGRLGLDLGS